MSKLARGIHTENERIEDSHLVFDVVIAPWRVAYELCREAALTIWRSVASR